MLKKLAFILCVGMLSVQANVQTNNEQTTTQKNTSFTLGDKIKIAAAMLGCGASAYAVAAFSHAALSESQDLHPLQLPAVMMVPPIMLLEKLYSLSTGKNYSRSAEKAIVVGIGTMFTGISALCARYAIKKIRSKRQTQVVPAS